MNRCIRVRCPDRIEVNRSLADLSWNQHRGFYKDLPLIEKRFRPLCAVEDRSTKRTLLLMQSLQPSCGVLLLKLARRLGTPVRRLPVVWA